jgi:hypothetical protein
VGALDEAFLFEQLEVAADGGGRHVELGGEGLHVGHAAQGEEGLEAGLALGNDHGC